MMQAAPDQSQPVHRGRFILKHLGLTAIVGFISFMLSAYFITLLLAIAPLFAIPKANKTDRATYAISTLLALVMLACVFGLTLLLFVMALGNGNWR